MNTQDDTHKAKRGNKMKNAEMIREMMKVFDNLSTVIKRENPSMTDVESLEIVKAMMNKSLSIKGA